MKLYVIIPDVHDKPPERLTRKVYHPAYRCVEEVIRRLKPNGIVFLGDISDVDSLNAFDMDKRRRVEGRRYKKDVDSVNHLLDRMQKIFPAGEKYYFIGNHEQRTETYLDYHPEMEGMMNWLENTNLIQRGYDIIRANEVKVFGKAWFMHGNDWSKYHAARMAQIYPKTIFYAHVHDVQEFTMVSPINVREIRKAQSLGCLCDLNPGWMRNKPNRWVHAFGLFWLKDNGEFQMDVKHIIRGEAIVNGKLFKG